MYAPYRLFDFTLLAPKVEPRTFTPDLDGLIAFCASKPSDESYDWHDCKGLCLLSQFTQAATGNTLYPRVLKRELQTGFSRIAMTEPWTFGAALTRARTLRSQLP